MTSASDLPMLLARKEALEQAAGRPDADSRARAELLDILSVVNRAATGTLPFRWPGHPYPLYFRCGTSDLSNFTQIFIAAEYEFPMPYEPARLFDLGGYAGYAAAYLANRFPGASIVSVEPSRDSFRMNSLNTGPFGNVRRLNAAVWEYTGSLSVANSLGGDWGITFSAVPGTGDSIPCYSLADLMTWAGWDSFDFLKCDIEGAEREVFRAARDLIATNVNVCAVELHEGTTPGAEAAVHACLDTNLFERFRHGEFDCFVRHDAGTRSIGAGKLLVLRPSSGLRGVERINVPEEAWGYYMFDGDSCQLHPGNTHAHPAMLRTQIELSGQTIFDSEISVWNPLGYPVKFVAELIDPEKSRRIFAREEIVAADSRRRLRFETGPLRGVFVLTLSTQMADGAPTNHRATANWHHPSFC